MPGESEVDLGFSAAGQARINDQGLGSLAGEKGLLVFPARFRGDVPTLAEQFLFVKVENRFRFVRDLHGRHGGIAHGHGLPDFGTLTVRYLPTDVCLELKSYKYYLTSFRNVGIYQEHAANRVLDDLVACCRPQWMEIELDYRLRGGIHTVVTVEYDGDDQ